MKVRCGVRTRVYRYEEVSPQQFVRLIQQSTSILQIVLSHNGITLHCKMEEKLPRVT